MDFSLQRGDTSISSDTASASSSMKLQPNNEDAPINGIYNHRHGQHLSRHDRAMGRRLLDEDIQPSMIATELGCSTSTVYKLKNDQYIKKDSRTEDIDCCGADDNAILRKAVQLVDGKHDRAHRPWQHLDQADHALCRFLLQHGVKPPAISAKTGWSLSTIDKIKHDGHVKQKYNKNKDSQFINEATWAMLRKFETEGSVSTKGKKSRVRETNHRRQDGSSEGLKTRPYQDPPRRTTSLLHTGARATPQCSPKGCSDLAEGSNLSILPVGENNGPASVNALDTHIKRVLRKYMLEEEAWMAPLRNLRFSAGELDKLAAQPQETIDTFVNTKFPTMDALSVHILQVSLATFLSA
ncbi:hypothetical protein C8R43DRAFT_1142694 [Mycena crocata]|nr:hypothetical protein C8R43DRAFT_1142694 [Mycena crocata]